MNRLLIILALVSLPAVSRAGGLLDFNPAEKQGRDAQKSVKKSVDGEVDKHKVTIGGDDSKKTAKRSKKKAEKASP